MIYSRDIPPTSEQGPKGDVPSVERKAPLCKIWGECTLSLHNNPLEHSVKRRLWQGSGVPLLGAKELASSWSLSEAPPELG